MSELSRCPNCRGEQVFNPDKGFLVCERCGSSFPVKETEGKIIRREYSPTFVPQTNTKLDVKYTCTTCGAKSVVGSDEEQRRCASCGNLSLTKQKAPSVVPDGIIPFSISRNKAAEIFRKWVGSRKFAPNDLKQMARLEKITGLYTPIWNFSYKTTVKYSATGIKIKTDDDGDRVVREYPIEKVKEFDKQNQIYSGSKRISNTFLNGLGDYEFSNIRPYSSDYLLGFAGIDTDIDIHTTYNGMIKDVIKSNEFKYKHDLENEYDQVDNFVCATKFRNVIFNYTYVPVWANHYTYKGKEYHCYINGQTGQAAGSAPKSALKILGLIGGILAGVVALGLIIASII